MTAPVMDMTGIVCAGCDTPLPPGVPYSQQLVAPELVVVVCIPCGSEPSRTGASDA